MSTQITIHVGNEVHANRRWDQVPRVGDEVWLQGSDPREPVRVKVERVAWRTSHEGPGEAFAELFCKRLKS